MSPACLSMLNASYLSPVSDSVQIDVSKGVHARTRWVYHHGDRWTNVTARTGRRVGLMKPNAHWDIILTSCGETVQQNHQIGPDQNHSDPTNLDPVRHCLKL